MRRDRRKKQDGGGLMMAGGFLCGVFTVVVIMSAISIGSHYDIIEAERAESLCTEMLELHKSTDGRYGWPSCSHLLS